MLDRTTKLLLAVIAAALWGLLLRPALSPTPAQAQVGYTPFPSSSAARFVVDNGDIYLYDGFGRVYHFDRSLNLLGRAVPVAQKNGQLSYTLTGP
jgi:hypothetical protein